MSNPNEHIILNIGGAKPTYQMLEGKRYMVVPMAMLTEGVHAGSNGPLYYPRDELSKTPVVWNHKPIVVYHPEENGKGVSACLPHVIESRKVGLVMNTRFDNKLRAEAWLDEAKLKKVDQRVLNSIQKGEMVEVSTGLFTDNEKKDGEWGGEKYTHIARNYRPDHLAILPDRKGACSIADGAGLLQLNEEAKNVIGLNMEINDDEKELISNYSNRWPAAKRHNLPKEDFAGPNETFPIRTQKDVRSAASLAHHAKNPEAVKRKIIAIAKRKGLKVPKAWQKQDATTNAAGLSHGMIRQALSSLLKTQGQVKTAHGVTGPNQYVHDVYDDFFISHAYGPGGTEKYYATPYEVEPQSGVYEGKDPDKAKTLKVKITGTPKEVQQRISWHDLQGNLVANEKDHSEEIAEVKSEMVKELVANGLDTEAEKEMLNRMSVDNLAFLLQHTFMNNQGMVGGSSMGTGAGATTGGTPAGGSPNPAVKSGMSTFPKGGKARKKKRKPMNAVMAPNGTAAY